MNMADFMARKYIKQVVISVIPLICAACLPAWAQQKGESDHIKERENNGAKPMRVAGETDLGWRF